MRGIPYILFLTCLICSCTLTDESLLHVSNDDFVEFVVRPTSYSRHEVSTKTAMDDYENRIYNSYFLLFDNNGNIIGNPVDLAGTLTIQRFAKRDLPDGFSTYTACFLANIPVDIVSGITTLTELNQAVIEISYTDIDINDADEGHSSFAVPGLDLTGDGQVIQCIPMVGVEECNLLNSDLFQISLKRLLAKVKVNISVNVNGASFDLLAAHLTNLPTQVNLVPPAAESAWVKDDTKFHEQQVNGPIDDDNISKSLLSSSSYAFYFYVPEYYLSPKSSSTENYGNEKYKPLMYDEEKNPVYLTLFGSYKSSSDLQEGTHVTYSLYLGENESTSYNLVRNKYYVNNILIKGVANSIDGTGSTMDCRVEIADHDMVEILGQTSNCYIITESGTYAYPAVKGVYKGDMNAIPGDMKCTKGTTLKILKQDNSAIQLTNLKYDSSLGEFSFEVASLDDDGGGTFSSNEGNIILGLVYTEGGVEKVEWSWHIWNTGASLQTYPNGYIVMDRNLGSTVATSDLVAGSVNGFYYKYGYKEPYVGASYIGGGESKTYDWTGDVKSQTDPCPLGYRVPTRDIWTSGTPEASHSAIYQAFQYWTDVYYPYSGYVDAGGVIVSTGTVKPDEWTTRPTVNLPHEQNPWDWTPSYGDITRPDNPRRFTNVKYRFNNISVVGAASARDSKMLEYAYENKGVEVDGCAYQKGTWISNKVQTGTFLGRPTYTTYYNASYDGDNLLINETYLTGAELQEKYPDEYTDLIKRLQVINAGNVLEDYLGAFSVKTSYDPNKDIDSSCGYQVRCVKE